MMRSNKLWLTLILVETFTLFCLGIVGNQIAALFQLPTYLLLIFAALGLSITAILSYFSRSSVETEHMAYQGLSFREILDRLTHRKGDSKFFAPGYPKTTQNLLLGLGFGGAFLYGVVAAFLRIPFTNSARPDYWYWSLAGFILLAFIPIFLIERQSYSSSTMGCFGKIFLHSFIIVFLAMIFVIGLGLGFLALFTVSWLFKFTY